MMSQPHSRSPLFSRNSTVPGRQAEGFYGDHNHSSVHLNQWREPENIKKLEGNSHWNNGPSQGEEEVDHWAKFIEAIGQAGRRRTAPMSRYNTQDDVQRFEEKQPHSPRRLPRERLASPKASHYGAETHQRIQSPGRRKNEHDFAHSDRHYSNRTHWDSRASSPRNLQGKRHDRMEHGYFNEEHEDIYLERSSFPERSLKSNYREHHPHPKRFRGLDPQEEYGDSHAGINPRSALVIVEHDHGIPSHDARNRDPSRSHDSFRNREHPRSRDSARQDRNQSRTSEPARSRDPPRTNDHTRSREPPKHWRGSDHLVGIPHDRQGGSGNYRTMEDTSLSHAFVERRSPMHARPHHREQSRMEPHTREHHGHRTMNLSSDVDLRNGKSHRARSSEHPWEEKIQPGRNHGMLEPAKVSKGIQHRRIPNTSAAPTTRNDFPERQNLRIKVDMSRPVGQSSHLGYCSERQLSLDLVNVGRQRLDFLPMLEHSGTYRESAMHSGTFAQEIITLLHQVKEHYFQGQGITLNERFSSEQQYSLTDEDEFDEEELELEDIRPVINRPDGSPSSDTQIFCNISSWQPQRRHAPAPGDLRHDLERRRQQRLEGVKITIAGASFSHMISRSQENEPAFIDGKEVEEAGPDFGWSEQVPQQTEQWDGPRDKLSSENFGARRNFKRFGSRPGLHMRRNPNNDANW